MSPLMRRAAVAPALLFLAVFGLYAATATFGGFLNQDPLAASTQAWAVGAHGTLQLDDLDLPPRLPGSDEPPLWIGETATGTLVAHRTVGSWLPAVPAYMIVAGSPFSLTPSGLTAAALSAAAVVVMHLALRRIVALPIAWAVTIVFALGTPTWVISADAMWTHTLTQPAIAAAALAASRSRWFAAGLALGVGILARAHVAVIAAVLGLGMAWSRRSLAPAIRVAVGSGIGLLVLVLLNRVVFGTWSIEGAGVYGYAPERLASVDASETAAYGEAWIGFLVAPMRGLIIWTPVILVLLPSTIRSIRSAPRWTLWLALGGLTYAFIQLRMNVFHGGAWFYTYRHGLELVTALTPLLALGFAAASRTVKSVAACVATLQVAAMAFLAVVGPGLLHDALVDPWGPNPLATAFSEAPAVMASYLVIAVLAATLVGLRVNRRLASPGMGGASAERPSPETADGASPVQSSTVAEEWRPSAITSDSGEVVLVGAATDGSAQSGS